MSTGGASYLPVFVRPDDPSNGGTEPPKGEEATAHASETAQRDPLYAALLGGKIGSALGPAAERETTMNTLDEPVNETIVLAGQGEMGWLLPSLDCSSVEAGRAHGHQQGMDDTILRRSRDLS